MTIIKLQITGSNIDLDSLTKLIGITPTFTCKKGNKSKVAHMEVTSQNDSWQYSVELDQYSEENVSNFIEVFSGCSKVFYELRKQGIVPFLVITHYIDNYQTIFSLPNTIIKLIAELNLELCFDIMCP